jgi:hypothetical protein
LLLLGAVAVAGLQGGGGHERVKSAQKGTILPIKWLATLGGLQEAGGQLVLFSVQVLQSLFTQQLSSCTPLVATWASSYVYVRLIAAAFDASSIRLHYKSQTSLQESSCTECEVETMNGWQYC